MDEMDSKIVQYLMSQGRMTWTELAGLLDLSAPATADRVRRLEERQVIQGYGAWVTPEAIGCGLLAFIAVTLEKPSHRAAFLQKVQKLTEIQECHHVTGNDDYWLKVRCTSTQALERLISEELKGLPGIIKTRTTIALSTVKESTVLPMPAPEAPC
jgi:Lrp/AsnC family transcriptional regulator, leucine-responsive regulatory protein